MMGCVLSMMGCPVQCNHAFVDIIGVPGDFINYQSLDPTPNPGCDCGGCSTNCFDFGFVDLDEFGHGESDPLYGSVRYIFVSRLGCVLNAFTPCSGSVQGTCNAFGSPYPQGQITINGSSVTCYRTYNYDAERYVYVCNTTTVAVTINGTTVSTVAKSGDTASTVAFNLANAINNDSTLGPMFGAVASGNVIYVQAKQAAIEDPWQSSCTYNSQYFGSCGFSASLSPVATMAPK